MACPDSSIAAFAMSADIEPRLTLLSSQRDADRESKLDAD